MEYLALAVSAMLLDPNKSGTSLGSLSAKYESNGNPGTIANNKGDIGGKSYGTYQLTTASGNAQKFANQYGGALKGLKVGTTAFDNAWKAEAKRNPEKFASAQHNYIQKTHYEPTANRFEKVTGIKASSLNPVVQDVLWSIGVQHGSGGAQNIFKNAGIKASDSASTIINKLYAERSKVNKYFASSSQSIKNSVAKRFANEKKEALGRLK